jgi:predicted AlkP superfamily phosphohydrolase/phosphomutase
LNRSSELIRGEKVIVIGLDGVTLDLVLPWVKEGKLPNLARFLEEGSWGELYSTIPVNSAPAWVSFATGKNPGKHGIYHFTELGNHTLENHFHNARTRKSNAIWNIASGKGINVIVVNVPFTYPPEEVKGIMISGLDAPGTNHTITYPPSVFSEINEATGGYEIEADLADLYQTRSDRDREEFLQSVSRVEDKRAETALYLMRKYPWQLSIIVFMATDRVQHRLWKYMDKNHPHHNPDDAEKFGDAILRVYQKMDEIVGRFLEEFHDSTFFIMSDHGFGPAAVKFIDLNKWLYSVGLLTFLQNDDGGFLKGIASRILSSGREALRKSLPVKLRHYIRKRLFSLNERLDRFIRLSNINWSSTKAYSDRTVDTVSTIWINLKGREPGGIVTPGKECEDLIENIIEKLNDLKDPATNEKTTEKVYRREEIYNGDNIHRAPDLIIKWKRDAYRTQSCIASKRNTSMTFIGDISHEETSLTASGEHKEKGVLMIKGKNVKYDNRVFGANITDIVPTILYSLNLPIPGDMDGIVLTDVFEDEYLKLNTIREDVIESQPEETGEAIYTPEDEREIEERLKGLGYLE